MGWSTTTKRAHSHLLDGIDGFDSVSISAHKWFFQPKESALVLFNDHEAAHASIAIDGAYLAVHNVGVLGSHGATAAHLLATLLALGRSGVADLIDHCMGLAEELHELVEAHDELVARSQSHTGIVCWRHRTVPPEDILRHLPPDVFVSSTTIAGEAWLRSVAANPLANPPLVIEGCSPQRRTRRDHRARPARRCRLRGEGTLHHRGEPGVTALPWQIYSQARAEYAPGKDGGRLARQRPASVPDFSGWRQQRGLR